MCSSSAISALAAPRPTARATSRSRSVSPASRCRARSRRSASSPATWAIVLILDEPANGLDPEGMRWMRSLLRDFADRGGTVLLSSHLLREVEAVADRLVIIGGGRVVAAGTRDELLAGAGTLAAAADGAGLEEALVAAGLSFARVEAGLVVDAEPLAVGEAALAGGVALTRLAPAEGAGLERLFFELTEVPA